MTPAARWSVAAALILLLGVGVLTRGDDWEVTATSYGSIPSGYGALLELLTELGLSRGRSFVEGPGLPDAATVWWIAPGRLCSGVESGDLSEADSGLWRSLDWIEAGGTAVVFLPGTGLPCFSDIEVAGRALPLRSIDRPVADADRDAGDGDAAPAPEEATIVSGPVDPEARSLGAIPLRFFESHDGFDTLVQDEAGRPLVVAAPLGAGRLVLAATAAPLRNQWLDHGDAAPFAADLAVALGPPFIDEREHGLLPTPDPFRHLLTSAAAPAFAGAALLAAVALWWGRALLPPTIEPDAPPPPSLEAFVSSTAVLYAATRDHGAVLRSYQEFALSQIRRAFLMPADVPARRVCERVLASRDLTDADVEPLVASTECRRASELHDRVARLDDLLARVAR